MNEISCTIKVGHSSEKHNHDVKYRDSLKHVIQYEDESERDKYVIELVNYDADASKSDKEKAGSKYEKIINDYMQKYIDEYNVGRDEAFAAARKRYEEGKIKSAPRKSKYKHIEQNWCDLHRDDTYKRNGKEYKIPLYRSIIFGIGNQEDRQDKKVTQEQALEIFKEQVEGFKISFSDFHLLGSTVHLDEHGFFHMHLDYFVAFEKNDDKDIKRRGPAVSTSFDDAMKNMGYEPEQSIINGRDKVPLYFNAMRNRMYHISDEAYRKQGIYMQYGTSKNPSVTNALDDWQKKQDMIKEVQHEKNEILEAIEDETKTPEQVAEIIEDKVIEIDDTINELKNSKRSRINKDNIIVSYTLFDQIDNLIKGIVAPIKALLISIADKLDDYDMLARDYQELKERNEILERENSYYKNKSLNNQIEDSSIDNLRKENALLKEENSHLKWYKKIYIKLIPILSRYKLGEEKLINAIIDQTNLSEKSKEKIIKDSNRLNNIIDKKETKEPER